MPRITQPPAGTAVTTEHHRITQPPAGTAVTTEHQWLPSAGIWSGTRARDRDRYKPIWLVTISKPQVVGHDGQTPIRDRQADDARPASAPPSREAPNTGIMASHGPVTIEQILAELRAEKGTPDMRRVAHRHPGRLRPRQARGLRLALSPRRRRHQNPEVPPDPRSPRRGSPGIAPAPYEASRQATQGARDVAGSRPGPLHPERQTARRGSPCGSHGETYVRKPVGGTRFELVASSVSGKLRVVSGVCHSRTESNRESLTCRNILSASR